jgi:general secretion pathway protein J
MSETNDTSTGFSVLEMLAALAIIALLMALMPGSLKLGRRAWQTVGGGEENAAAATLTFVSDHLQAALPIYHSDTSGLQRLAFSGNAESLRFVTELDLGPRGSGLYTIALNPNPEGGIELLLSPFRPDGAEDSLAVEARSITGGISGLSLRYFGPPDPNTQPKWQKSWSRDDRLPDLVELTPLARNRTHIPASMVELRLRPH